MIRKIDIIVYFLFLSFALNGFAQNPYEGEIKIDIAPCELSGDSAVLRARIDLRNLRISRNEIIVLKPTIQSLDGYQGIELDPVVISGSRRLKMLKRQNYYGANNPNLSGHNLYVLSRKNTMDSIELKFVVLFEKWMRSSRLVFEEWVTGCERCGILLYADGRNSKRYMGEPYGFPPPYEPVYKAAYMTPPVEEIKIQSDSYSAQLNFQTGKSELLRTFGNNGKILAEVDDIINRVKTDTLLTLRNIVVKGYASPEGGTASNLRLSRDRANAFVAYLHGRHRFYQADRIIRAEGMGEDWDGLRKALLDSYLPDRDRVIEAINNITNVERRKSYIRGLSGGRTYYTLLNEYYPSLRRNEYTITYEVRGFNQEEARVIFQTRPQLLSLNEMFMVANLYEHNSEEFKQLFDVAVRLYPDSPIAQFNVAAMEIEQGMYAKAITRLLQIDVPQSWNNLGIAYWHTGEYDQAYTLFAKASQAGLEEARHNMEQYRLWNEDRD